MKFIRHLHAFIPFFFFGLCICIFFWQTILLGKLPVPTDTLVGMYHPWRDMYATTYERGFPFKNPLITDPVRQQIPWRKQAIDDIKQNTFSFWDATSFLGTSLLSNIQSGLLYPLNVLFFFLPFPLAWTILIMSQPFLAGVFMYFFLRQKTLSPIAAVGGGMIWSFSGFSIAWLTWGTMLATVLWLPLILLCLEKIQVAKKPILWALLCSFSLSASFFAGHAQLFLYTCVVVALYVLSMGKKRWHWMYIGIFLLTALCTAPVWMRFFAFIPTTARIAGSAFTKEGFFIPIQHLIQFFVPDFFGNPATLNYWGVWNYGEMIGYIGVGGILLALLGVGKSSLFFLGLVVVSLLFAVDSPFARLPFVFHIPGLSALQPTRLLSIVDFGLAVLAAYGLEFLMKKTDIKKSIMILGVTGCVFLGLWISVFKPVGIIISPEQMMIAKRNLMIPTLVWFLSGMVILCLFVVKKMKGMRYIIPILLLCIFLGDVFRFGWKFTPFTDSAFFFPETEVIQYLKQQPKPYRVMTTDDRIMPPNTNAWYGIEMVGGYDPLYDARYEKFMAALERGKPDITPPYGFTRIIVPKNIHSNLFPLLFASFVLSFEELSDPRFVKVMTEGTTKVYTYTDALPRVMLLNRVLYKETEQAVFDALYQPDFDPKTTVVVETPLPFTAYEGGKDDSMHITSYKDDHITLSLETPAPRFLLVGNRFDPQWTIMIDGVRQQIVRANYLYFGCIIPEGNHTIDVIYAK